MKSASHTQPSSASGSPALVDVGRVDPAEPSLPERLAGKVSEQLEAFAAQMREGLLAASVAIGLNVMRSCWAFARRGSRRRCLSCS